jgi:hypothetical protein
MNKVPSISGRAKAKSSLVQFDPNRHRLKVAALDFTIEEARRIKDWPALEEAVDAKIAQQVGFVAWWKANVTGQGTRTDLSRDRGKSLPMRKAEKETGMANQRVSDLAVSLGEPDIYRERLLGIEYRAAFLSAAELSDNQRIQQSLSNEHYTPAKYIEAARKVLGGIDLDPASNDLAQETVQAGTYYTKDDDGLTKEWRGRVWLNPPYGDIVGKFIDKLSGERAAGRVSAAICVVNAHCTDTAWFQQLWDGCLCFTNHRINFTGDETRSGSTHGSVFVYFGQDREKFARLFLQFGACVVKM